jgi:hypothetical protein
MTRFFAKVGLPAKRETQDPAAGSFRRRKKTTGCDVVVCVTVLLRRPRLREDFGDDDTLR